MEVPLSASSPSAAASIYVSTSVLIVWFFFMLERLFSVGFPPILDVLPSRH